MQQDIQNYIDAYSNFLLNHLLLAENPNNINIIRLDVTPSLETFTKLEDGVLYKDLEYLFKAYTPIKLGDLLVTPTSEIALYFLCKEPKFSNTSVEVFFDSYYQLKGSEYIIMMNHNLNTPNESVQLETSSLITYSLNLGRHHDYEIYKVASEIIRKTVIRFYSVGITKKIAESNESHNIAKYDMKSLDSTNSPADILSSQEIEALSRMFQFSSCTEDEKSTF